VAARNCRAIVTPTSAVRVCLHFCVSDITLRHRIGPAHQRIIPPVTRPTGAITHPGAVGGAGGAPGVQPVFILAGINSRPGRFGGFGLRGHEMKTALIALSAAVIVVGSALAVLNNVCKSSQHSWCAPNSSIKHHAKLS
jgi:hypothetical protein